ncbi:hypothetical protein KUCAC02_002019, partial [Chaenocephalus aceratus]
DLPSGNTLPAGISAAWKKPYCSWTQPSKTTLLLKPGKGSNWVRITTAPRHTASLSSHGAHLTEKTYSPTYA